MLDLIFIKQFFMLALNQCKTNHTTKLLGTLVKITVLFNHPGHWKFEDESTTLTAMLKLTVIRLNVVFYYQMKETFPVIKPDQSN